MRKYSISASLLLMLVIAVGIECYLRVKSGTRIDTTLYQRLFYGRCFFALVAFVKLFFAFRNEQGRLIFRSLWYSFKFLALPAMIAYGFLFEKKGDKLASAIGQYGFFIFAILVIVPCIFRYFRGSRSGEGWWERYQKSEEEQQRRSSELEWQRRQIESRSTYKW